MNDWIYIILVVGGIAIGIAAFIVAFIIALSILSAFAGSILSGVFFILEHLVERSRLPWSAPDTFAFAV